jgi:hypothetical protein
VYESAEIFGFLRSVEVVDDLLVASGSVRILASKRGEGAYWIVFMQDLPSKHETNVRFERSGGCEVVMIELNVRRGRSYFMVRSLEMQLSSHEHGTVGECTTPAEHHRPAISQIRLSSAAVFVSSRDSGLASSSAQDSSEINTCVSPLLMRTHGPDGGHTMFEVVRWWKHSGFDLIPLDLT